MEFAFLIFIIHMFRLPPRTLANCTVLLIIKARKNKKDNALECFTETALYNSETEKTKLDIQERDISVEIQIEVVEYNIFCPVS